MKDRTSSQDTPRVTSSLTPIEGAPGLWQVEHDLFQAAGLVHFRCRMTVAELDQGGLLLCAPVPIDDALADELARLGEARVLFAPNLFHHLHLADAQRRYPEAELIAISALASKRPELRFDHLLGPDDVLPPALAASFDSEVLRGMPKVQERVLLHRATRTVIATDLLFNLCEPCHCQTRSTRLLFRLMGAYGRPAQSRLWRSMIKDRETHGASLRRLLAWEFERLVPAHGAIIAGAQAKARVEAALSRSLALTGP
jgi:hypothetical protein